MKAFNEALSQLLKGNEMTERDMAENNKILSYEIGSHLYGTNVATSDHDYAGVFIANKEYYLGLQNVKEVDFSVVSKLDNGRNAADAVDMKLYELRNFVRLAIDNNPNIIEQLFVPDEKIVSITEEGDFLLSIRHMFPHKGLASRFIGYAKGQLHKMSMKPENYDELQKFKLFFEERLLPNLYNKFIGEVAENYNFSKAGDQFFQIGDLKFNPKVKMSDVYDSVVARLSKATSRTDLYTKYGYDTKFGMHCIRLLFEGIELLETGSLEMPLKNKELLLDIRNGLYSASQVIEYAEQLTKDVDAMVEKSPLPNKADSVAIEKAVITLIEEYLF